MSKATDALASYIAQQVTSGGVVVLDEMVFAYIPGLTKDTLDANLTMPAASNIKHRQAISQVGYVNQNAVVYSVTMGTEVGDFDFNFIGLINKSKNLLGVAVYTDTIKKIKNQAGKQGNAITRSILLEFNNAKEAAGITIPAETWQIDFTARLGGIDEKIRLANLDLYGRQVFIGNAGKAALSAGNLTVSPGVAYIAGLRVDIPTTTTTTTTNAGVWLDVYEQGTVTGAHGVVAKIVVKPAASPLQDYTDAAGNRHYAEKIADINSAGQLTDRRVVKWVAWSVIRDVPSASLAGVGLVKLSNATDSDAQDVAATPRAVKGAKTAADAAQKSADNAKTAADNAQKTADKKAAAHNHVDNLNNLSGSQFFGCYSEATGVPSDLSGIDLNGIHADAGYQKTQILFVSNTDIRVRYNDDGQNWTGWEKIAMLPEVEKRVLKTGDTMTGHLSIKQGDYSSVRTFNSAGESVRWESFPTADKSFGSITHVNSSGNPINKIWLPKKTGTVALTSDVDTARAAADKNTNDFKKVAVTNIRLGSSIRRTLSDGAWDTNGSGQVVTGFNNISYSLDTGDYVYLRPIQKYVNGAWVTISNA